MKSISFQINSKIELINIVEQGTEFFLKSMCKISEDSVYWFLVGFHEILVNAFLHGNKKNENLFIDVNVSFDNVNIIASVKDMGKGFNIEDIPDPTAPENILKPCGRGLLFARKSCDSVSFKKEEDGFKITLVKKAKEV